MKSGQVWVHAALWVWRSMLYLSLTSSMFQYLVMTEFSGYSLISVASCSPITWFFSSAWIKSRTFLPKENEPDLFYSALNMYIFQNDQVHFILFSCIWLVICHISFHTWHESSDRELDQTAPSIWFLCSGFIHELFMSFSEREISIILWFDSMKKLSSLERDSTHVFDFCMLSLLAVLSMHISLINLIRDTVHKNILAKPKD